MTGTNKLEQMITGRPNSYVPARTIGNHLGVSADFYRKNTDLLNHVHHFGMGMLAGPVRALMSYYGVIGPVAAFIHTGVRIMMDQTVELTAGPLPPVRLPELEVPDWPVAGVLGDVLPCAATTL